MPPVITCNALDQDHWSIFLGSKDPLVPSFESSFVPLSRRGGLLANFSELLDNCKEADWNGEAANAIDVVAENAAYQFIKSLPSDIPDPDIDPIPEGLVAFEWYKGPKNVVSVVPNANNGIDYAVRKGNEIIHGSAPFFGAIPTSILSHVRSLTK